MSESTASFDANGIMEDMSRARFYCDLNKMGVISDDETKRQIRDIVFRELDMITGINPS